MGKVAYEIAWDLDKQPWSDPAWVGDIRLVGGEAAPSIRPVRGGQRIDQHPMHIWEMPQPQVAYTVAIDPSTGRENGDPAAIQVVAPWGRQVAEVLLRQRGLEEQSVAAMWLAYFYNEAVLVIEMNTFGSTMFSMINDHMGYPRMWHESGTRPGFTTTSWSRDVMIRKMQASLRMGAPILRSRRMKEQFSVYRGDGPPDDDLVMAMLIAHQCCVF